MTAQLPKLSDIEAASDPAELRALVRQLHAMVSQLLVENAALKRAILGPKSERLPPMDREVKEARDERQGQRGANGSKSKERRKDGTEKKRRLPVIEIEHEVREEDLHCPQCGGTSESFRDLGEGEPSFEYEFVPAHFICRKHIRRKKACRCGATIVTAPAPPRVSEGVQYGPGFHAQVVVAKCADSMPLYRQAKQLHRVGLSLCRSTLCDIFHRCADLLRVLRDRMIELVAKDPHVNADETSIRVQDKGQCRRSFIWTFIAARMVVYRYSADRSGETPSRILGGTTGVLQVDGYSGYNHVTTPEGRTRAGCHAHARRYFWGARETAPQEAEHALEQILELYLVEYEAAEQQCLGTERHLALRQARSAPIMARLHSWLEEQKPLHAPQSPMAKAIGYVLNNWDALSVFLTDPKVKLDNNISEAELRIIALGRKNFLFVGHDEAGDNLAVLQSLVSSCELNGVNPQQYLADVLIRIQHHPASRLDELLPHNWTAPGQAQPLPA